MSIKTNLNELNKYRGMLLKSEFMEKWVWNWDRKVDFFKSIFYMYIYNIRSGFSRNVVINFLMYVFGVAQLSSIHLGHDRNFTMLVRNEKPTKVRCKIRKYY